MRTMLTRRGLVSLLCLVLLGTVAHASPAAAAATATVADAQDDGAEFKLISEGLGIKGVYVWRSTEGDVVAAYGKDYELIKHSWYTYELRYVLHDLSFYYCQNDPQKRIIDIECRAGFGGFTAKGIVPGKSTVRDVFKAYGESEMHGSAGDGSVSFHYPGVQFSIVETDESDDDLKQLLNRKIDAIDIVTSKTGSDCLPSNVK